MQYRRGINAHKEIDSTHDLPPAGGGKGRNKELLKARNEAMLCRYYYYSKLLRYPYELVLTELQKDFFLSCDTIPRIVEAEIGTIKKMIADKATAEQLAKRFPQFTWNSKPLDLKGKVVQKPVYELPDKRD